ncbi:hypothetical protein H0G86_005002 [Trichoderma simmonsii]|uniref:Uncharacterized protein n=1 Tax=Trichoderma simmonsii TaxID=1491479 RepID=A0A8G0LDG9_9HYPO|nr:hypothetical protein H0G86_005002 [Trichoderma simmonsii]
MRGGEASWLADQFELSATRSSVRWVSTILPVLFTLRSAKLVSSWSRCDNFLVNIFDTLKEPSPAQKFNLLYYTPKRSNSRSHRSREHIMN